MIEGNDLISNMVTLVWPLCLSLLFRKVSLIISGARSPSNNIAQSRGAVHFALVRATVDRAGYRSCSLSVDDEKTSRENAHG